MGTSLWSSCLCTGHKNLRHVLKPSDEEPSPMGFLIYIRTVADAKRRITNLHKFFKRKTIYAALSAYSSQLVLCEICFIAFSSVKLKLDSTIENRPIVDYGADFWSIESSSFDAEKFWYFTERWIYFLSLRPDFSGKSLGVVRLTRNSIYRGSISLGR